ncbi:hypothetical protein Tco_0658956 [Tanacetum coccineum]
MLYDQKFQVDAELLRDALQITPKDPDHPFVEPPSHDDIVSFIKELGYLGALDQVSNMVEEKKGVEVVVWKIETIRVLRKKRIETVLEETSQSEEVADTVDSEETDDEEEGHLNKLKGVETLSSAAQFLVDMKTATKASKDDFILKQRPKGPGEGSTGEAQAKVSIPEPQMEKPAVPLPNSSLTLSSAEYEDHVVQRTPVVDTVISILLEKITLSPKQQPPQSYHNEAKHKKIEAMSKIDHNETIEESVQANVINEVKSQLSKFLPKVVSEYVRPRMESSMDIDEAIAKGELYPTKTLRKRHHDDDQDPPADSEKDKKKRRRKDTDPSKKDKDTAGLSNKGKAPSKSSKSDKTVNAEESVQDAAMDAGESIEYDVMDAEDPTKVDVVPKQDNSKWFKQDVVVKPETPDP